MKAQLKDLEKFTQDGKVKPRVSVYNEDLAICIDNTIAALHDAYSNLLEKNLSITSDNLQLEADKLLNGEASIARFKNPTLLERFAKFREDRYRDNIFAENRYKHYRTLHGKLSRFLKIKRKYTIKPGEFTTDLLMEFRAFILDEYKYVSSHPHIYADMAKRDTPTQRRGANTIVTEMKMLQAFFTELEDNEEIQRSPFRKLGRERKKSVMKARFNDPYFLRKEEFLQVLNANVPNYLTETRDAFLLNCALGFRIGDFKSLTMENVAVSPEGIPYIHYLPHKTRDTQSDYSEIETPILPFALDIIKRTKFNFPVLRNQTGRTGYNPKIRALLQACKIDRKVTLYNELKGENEYPPIYSVAGSSLARKTHVDMMTKVQVDLYASGLHKQGSGAVHHYTKIELADRFALMCAAFDQEPYRVDGDLNIISPKSSQK